MTTSAVDKLYFFGFGIMLLSAVAAVAFKTALALGILVGAVCCVIAVLRPTRK